MSSTRYGAKRLESAISICLLAVLFLIAAGVFLKQSDYDMSRFGMDTSLDGRLIATELSFSVPAGFETLSETEVYNPENLYEKIDGKAPFYIESGFERLFTRRFVSKDKDNLWMELFVYDMGNVKNAFSVYSTQRRADADILSLFHTSFGYRTANALYFVHGNYYIELVGSSEAGELFKAMVEVAKQLRSELAVDKITKIAELDLFPTENIISGSIKLYLANAFGFEGLTDTFTAEYNIGDETITAFLSRRFDPKAAQLIVESYYNFLINNGGEAKQSVYEVPEIRVVDFYGTTEIVFAIGPFVAGIHEAEKQQAAEKLAEMLISRLAEQAKVVENDRAEQ